MDEFKRKAKAKNLNMEKPEKGTYDDMWNSIPKKFGRKSARRKLKNSIQNIYSEHEWWRNDQLFNTWDINEWDDHGRYDMLCNELEEYDDWGEWDTEVDHNRNLMDWTNDAIRF